MKTALMPRFSLRKLRQLGLLAVALCGLSACGSSEPTGEIIDTVPAAGTLTYKGQPLKYHQVTFLPSNNRAAAGTTDEEGKFVLGTNDVGDGAVAGLHRIKVTYVGPPDTNPEAGMTDFSPPPPPDVKIPDKYKSAESSELTFDIPASGDTDIKLDLQ